MSAHAAAGAVGVAQSCLDEAVKYCNSREQFGQKIGMFVGIEAKATDKHSPTDRQAICLREIHMANGAALVVSKDNLEMLQAFLEGL